MARAVVASAAANGVLLAIGAIIPRLLVVGGAEYLIENGCGREMIAAGVVDGPLVQAPPWNEAMRLTGAGFRHVVACISARRLVDLGVLDPGAEASAAGG